MKRSMLLVLAGFGLASMLFALVAFVGTESKGVIILRTQQSYRAQEAIVVIISHPDGKVEQNVIDVKDVPAREQYSYAINAINIAVNKVAAQGYALISHQRIPETAYLSETFVFQKE